MNAADHEISLHNRIRALEAGRKLACDAWVVSNDRANAMEAERDAAIAERDTLAAEVARLQRNPLATLLSRIPATEAPFELVYHPSDVGDPGWSCMAAKVVTYGDLDTVIAAACERLGVDLG